MRQNTARTLRVHLLQARHHVIQLRQRIDDDKHIRRLQILRIPEEHPRSDAHIAQREVGYVVDDGVEFLLFLGGFLWVQAPEAVQPGELEELLGCEEAGDEPGLRGEVGEVGVVDGFHVWGGEHLQWVSRDSGGRIDGAYAILLGGEVVKVGDGSEVFAGAIGDPHDDSDGGGVGVVWVFLAYLEVKG